MHGWLYEELKIAGWVILPILCGVLLRRVGVPKAAARGFFGFAFYGCQTGVTFYPLFYWGLARAVGLSALDTAILVLYGLVPSALLANLLAVFFELDTDLTSSMFLVSTGLFLVFVLPVFTIAVVR